MANTFLTPSIIAREMIIALLNNMVFANLVHRDYSSEFDGEVGDTITIRKPAEFTAENYNGSTVTIQDATEVGVPVTLDHHIDVSFKVTAKQMALELKDFRQQLLLPAMRAHAQYIDAELAKLYRDIPYYKDVGGAPAIGDIQALNEQLNVAKVPFEMRRNVLGPTTESKYVVLDQFINADKSGQTGTLREAEIGRVLRMDHYMDQNVVSHVKGTAAGTATLTATSGLKTGTVASGGNLGTFKKGDIFTLASTAGTYVVTADATMDASGDGSINFYPAAPGAISGEVMTLRANHVANMAFHRNAFALVTRPLPAPMSNNRSEVISELGVSARAVYDYDINLKSDVISLDILAGFKTLTEELAVRFHDPS